MRTYDLFVNGSTQNEQSLERTIIDASYQASLHIMTTRVEQRTFCVLKNDMSQKMDHTVNKKS